MKNRLLIYGSYGYTGELISKLAAVKQLNPILSGRDKEKVNQLASALNLEARPIELSNSEALKAALQDVKVVIHAAGPFIHTYEAMASACLATGTHYLDITGEIPVFEGLADKDGQAKQANILLMPGTGFDVVPSDCLAAHLKERLPDASHLKLAFYSAGRSSRGTAKTVVESLGQGGAVRRDGKIVAVPAGYKISDFDFGEGKLRTAATIPWGDVSTAWYSTGIPNIEVYMAMHGKQAAKLKYVNWLGWLLNKAWVKNYLKKQIDKQAAGPDEATRKKGKVWLYGEAANTKGDKVSSQLQVPEGYTLTAMTSVAIAEEVLKDNWKNGFHTPSSLFGAGFILRFEGVVRKDL